MPSNISNRVSHPNLNQTYTEGSPLPAQPSSSKLEENSDQKPSRFNAPKLPTASSFEKKFKIPIDKAISAYKKRRFYHGTTYNTKNPNPDTSNADSIWEHGLVSGKKKNGDMETARFFLKHTRPQILEKMNNPEEFIANDYRIRSIQNDKTLPADEKKNKLKECRESLLELIKIHQDPGYDEKYLADVESRQEIHFLTQNKKIAEVAAVARCTVNGRRDPNLKPIIMRVILTRDEIAKLKHNGDEIQIQQDVPSQGFLAKPIDDQPVRGVEAFLGALEDEGIHSPSLEDVRNALIDVQSDFEDDFDDAQVPVPQP